MTDPKPTEQQIADLNQVSDAASQISQLTRDGDYAAAERAIAELGELVASLSFRNDSDRHFASLRYRDAAGSHWELRAVNAYVAEVDPTDSNTFSLRAIDNHEKALDHARSVEIGDTEEINAFEDELVARQEALLIGARGMRDLNAGEVQLKSGQFPRAKETLTKAVEYLTRSEAVLAEQSAEMGENADPGFSDVARALLEQTNGEIALISGELETAASAEKQRALALEAANQKHAVSGQSTSDYFARRMKHDAEFAHARSQLFEDAASRTEARPWFNSYLFFVLAIGSAVALVYALGSFELIESPFAIGLIFVFVFIVAGVATRQAKWSEGAELLSSIAKSAKD